MAIWRIVPAPRDVEAALLGFGHWEEVIVRAASAAQARVVAASELGDRSRPIGNESAAGHAGLEDKNVYRVVEVSSQNIGGEPADGREGVVKAVWAHDSR